MFEADFSRTERRARVDYGTERASFAQTFLQRAQGLGEGTVVWHFATKESVAHLHRDPKLGSIAKTLQRKGHATVNGLKVLLATKQLNPPAASFKAPLAAWWTTDDQLLDVDSTHRSLLDALVSDTTRAPIWLTAFDIDIGEEIGVKDPNSGVPGQPTRRLPIEVSREVQEAVRRASGGMTLSTNGIHDSLGGYFLKEVRPLLKNGRTTREAVAVAALRAGWWPEKINDLVKKL